MWDSAPLQGERCAMNVKQLRKKCEMISCRKFVQADTNWHGYAIVVEKANIGDQKNLTMQGNKNPLGQALRNTGSLRQLLAAGGANALNATEMFEQGKSFVRADAGNMIQAGL